MNLTARHVMAPISDDIYAHPQAVARALGAGFLSCHDPRRCSRRLWLNEHNSILQPLYSPRSDPQDE